MFRYGPECSLDWDSVSEESRLRMAALLLGCSPNVTQLWTVSKLKRLGVESQTTAEGYIGSDRASSAFC